MSSPDEKSNDGPSIPLSNTQIPATRSLGSRFAFWKASKPGQLQPGAGNSYESDEDGEAKASIPRSNLWILNDKLTDEVPGKCRSNNWKHVVLAMDLWKPWLTRP